MGKKLKFYIIKWFLFLFSFLPFSVLYVFSDGISFILSQIINYRRKTIMDNLLYSFPEKSEMERKEIARLFYSHLSDLLVESIKMFSMNRKQIKNHFLSPLDQPDPDNKMKEALELIQNSQGCIGMLGHYGNWEWASFVSSINFPEKENWIIYKTLADKDFDNLLNQVRSRFGAIMIEMKAVARKFVAKSGAPYLAYFVSDQTPMELTSFHKITFLNQETLVYLGAEKIACSKNIPVVYIEIQKLQRGFYTSSVEILTRNSSDYTPEEINLKFQRRLEKTIQEKPEYWLWSHKRWKYTRT
jgi:KDO2-lipid IV(A) lauroyltransferase